MDSWRSMSEWKLQIIHRRSYHTVWNQFKLLFKLFWEFVTWKFSHEHFRSPFVGKGHKCDTPSLICPWNSIKINIATISNCIPSNCLGKVKRNPRINQVDTYNLIFQKKIHVYMCENFNCAFQYLPSERLIHIFFFFGCSFYSLFHMASMLPLLSPKTVWPGPIRSLWSWKSHGRLGNMVVIFF